MSDIKVSIVVPVYNAEKFLNRILEPLVNQTLKEIEIICVDDGSKDSSGKIIDEYAEKYSAVRSFHKKNGGIISARVFGVENSCGKYIAFVDSDDFIDPFMYKDMIHNLKENNLDLEILKNYSKTKIKVL